MSRVVQPMWHIAQGLCLAALLVIYGCSTDTVKRAAYDTLQNYSQLQCQNNPSASCPKGPSYDDYQRLRAAHGAPGR